MVSDVQISTVVKRVPNAKAGRESTDIEIYGMQGIPPDVLAAHYGEEEDPAKTAKVDIISSQYVGGVVPGSLAAGYPPRATLGAVPPLYNPAVPSVLLVGQFPLAPNLGVHSILLSRFHHLHLGLPQQPLFPVQNVRPPVPATAPPTLQPSLPIAPPGLPVSNPPVPVSQPLFPVVPNNNNLVQSLPMLMTSVPLSSPAEVNGSI
ncbi:protein SUPPRESSOR OF FRI 4-like [Lycium ferocissimum]|uniref:protein SUPPRESSOR OF FRI 4-like n=1 Tax=Lycium ferocissimum TaxID=112874 RepID=UPI0028150357|nr:protein SUPPRESSOR OF FRI 4-like [Lycium ferocissimum]